jgi:hypothetical protein
MKHSGIFEWMYRLAPVRAWKGRLAAHMEKCPDCARRLAGRDEVRRVLIQAGDLGRLNDIWPIVRKAGPGIGRDRSMNGTVPGSAFSGRPRRLSLVFRWASALSGLAVVSFMLVGVVRYIQSPSPSPAVVSNIVENDGFILHSARVDNRSANTYILQSNDGMILVWVEKSL